MLPGLKNGTIGGMTDQKDPRSAEPAQGNPQIVVPPDQDASQIRKELHILEKINIVGQLVLVIVGLAAVVVYNGQLRIMRRQLKQMEGSSTQTDILLCLYAKQLQQLSVQNVATHGMATASIFQAVAVTQSESPR